MSRRFDCPYCDQGTVNGLPARDAYTHLLIRHRDELPEHWRNVVNELRVVEALPS